MASLGSQLGKMPMGPEEDEDSMMPSSPMDEEAPEAESDVPPDFQAAYEDWELEPSPSTMYAMIEACKAGGGGGKPDLALILGGKGKKP